MKNESIYVQEDLFNTLCELCKQVYGARTHELKIVKLGALKLFLESHEGNNAIDYQFTKLIMDEFSQIKDLSIQNIISDSQYAQSEVDKFQNKIMGGQNNINLSLNEDFSNLNISYLIPDDDKIDQSYIEKYNRYQEGKKFNQIQLNQNQMEKMNGLNEEAKVKVTPQKRAIQLDFQVPNPLGVKQQGNIQKLAYQNPQAQQITKKQRMQLDQQSIRDEKLNKENNEVRQLQNVQPQQNFQDKAVNQDNILRCNQNSTNQENTNINCDNKNGGQSMFRSAKNKLINDWKKQGQNPDTKIQELENQNAIQNRNYPVSRNYLSRNNQQRQDNQGFVPPFVRKGLDQQNSYKAINQNDQNQSCKDGESQYSQKVLDILQGPDGQLPEKILQLDPKLVEMVCNEVMDQSSNVEWEDIAGLDYIKKLIKEIIVWPMMNPQFFKGARAPPKGVLLFGPPGTGKTLIGKAVASNIKATFFSISASSLTSKWIGEGEKMVRTLFTVASCLQPAVIFVDEIDSVLSARKSDGEHESSRRMKTEMLIQLDGCDPASQDRRLLLIGATNRPEELDDAARRRLPKQVYVHLPCELARRQIILRQIKNVKNDLSEVDMNKVVEKTAGYSGSDMKQLIQEACQRTVRDAVLQKGDNIIYNITEEDIRPLTKKDFQMAMKIQPSSVKQEELERYVIYDQLHGAKLIDITGNDEDDDW